MKNLSTLLLLILVMIFASGQDNQNILTYEGVKLPYVKNNNDRGHLSADLNSLFNSRHNLLREIPSLKSTDEIKYRLDGSEILFWDNASSTWQAEYKEEYVYNSNELIESKLAMEWDFNTSQWEEGWKTAYTYDANNNLTVEVESSWDEGAGQWIPEEKFESSYNDNDKLVLVVDYEWDDMNNQWMQESKSEYTYNSSGYLAMSLSYEWDPLGNQWVNEWRYEYTYDGDGNLTQEVDHRWDQSTMQFIINWKHEYTYNTSGQLIQEIDQEWDEWNSQWLLVWKSEYEYDLNGNLELEFSHGWDQGSSQWLIGEKTAYSYDNAYGFSQLILPFPFDEIIQLFNHMLLDITAYGWDEASNSWFHYYKYEFVYSEQNIGSVGEIDENLLRFYPNPAQNELHITLQGHTIDEVSVYSLTGQQVLHQRPEGSTIDISSLHPGMYIVEVSIENTLFRQKLLVE